jgi:hypothetical protein
MRLVGLVCVVVLSACTELPRPTTSSAVSEDASVAPLPRIAAALTEDAPPIDDAAAPPMEHHHHAQ